MVINAPNGALAVALSLIPFSAPVAMLLRLARMTVPLWHVASSLVLLEVAAVFMSG